MGSVTFPIVPTVSKRFPSSSCTGSHGYAAAPRSGTDVYAAPSTNAADGTREVSSLDLRSHGSAVDVHTVTR